MSGMYQKCSAVKTIKLIRKSDVLFEPEHGTSCNEDSFTTSFIPSVEEQKEAEEAGQQSRWHLSLSGLL